MTSNIKRTGIVHLRYLYTVEAPETEGKQMHVYLDPSTDRLIGIDVLYLQEYNDEMPSPFDPNVMFKLTKPAT